MAQREILKKARELGILIIPASVKVRRASIVQILRGCPTVPLSELRIIARRERRRKR